MEIFMIINRQFAMPNKNTFLIKPIQELILKYIDKNKIWIDPFCNDSFFKNYCKYTNDLNPNYDTTHHLDSLKFLKIFDKDSIDGILFDPPYTLTQVKQCYQGVGIEKLSKEKATLFPTLEKDTISKIIKSNGFCICFGYDSNGIGINRGFKLLEILLINHGGRHNDTICTVEQKIQNYLF